MFQIKQPEKNHDSRGHESGKFTVWLPPKRLSPSRDLRVNDLDPIEYCTLSDQKSDKRFLLPEKGVET